MTTYEATLGPVTVPPGDEQTQCLRVRLGNEEGVFVRRFRTELSEGAHHFIVYRSLDSEETLEPAPCPGFGGFAAGEQVIHIAQHGKKELVFPTDAAGPVGLEIAPHQMLLVEMHWLNASNEPLVVRGTAALDTIPLASEVVPSDTAFWGTSHLNAGGEPPGDAIPPFSKGDTGVLFQPALPDTKSFALTTHQHFLATRMRVWYASGAGALGPLVADTGNWADPPLEVFDPPLEFPAAEGDPNASESGFSYRCEWNNTTSSEITFGESAATNEMCFLWHYYYPAKGLHYCLDGEC